MPVVDIESKIVYSEINIEPYKKQVKTEPDRYCVVPQSGSMYTEFEQVFVSYMYSVHARRGQPVVSTCAAVCFFEAEEEEEETALSQYSGFFPTNRGGRMLVLNGFHFRLDRNFANRTAWKCRVNGCRSRCITNDEDKIVKSTKTQTHNHPIDWKLLQKQFQLLDTEVVLLQAGADSLHRLVNS